MGFIVDKDGTLVANGKPIDGAIEFINLLNMNSINYIIMTNNIRSPNIQAERLRKIGFEVSNDRIINPISSINEYIKEKGYKKARIIGTEDAVLQVCCESVEKGNEITILIDFEHGNVAFNELQTIVNDIENGIEIVTASNSLYYYNNEIKTIDTGAFAKLIESVSGKKILNLGKPSIRYFDFVQRILCEKKECIEIIGDDWETDIKGANDWGAKSILVKSGKYRSGDEMIAIPDRIVNSLIEIEIRNHRTIGST